MIPIDGLLLDLHTSKPIQLSNIFIALVGCLWVGIAILFQTVYRNRFSPAYTIAFAFIGSGLIVMSTAFMNVTFAEFLLYKIIGATILACVGSACAAYLVAQNVEAKTQIEE